MRGFSYSFGTRLRWRFSFAFIALFVLPSILQAQSFRGTIRGSVRDATGALMADARITARSTATGLVRAAVSGTDGGYVMAELPVGVYTVTVEVAGFSPVAQNVVVSVGLDTTADFDVIQLQKHVETVTV